MCEMCQQMQLSFVAKCWCSCLVGLGVCWVVSSLDDVLCFDGISIVPRRRRKSKGLFINKNVLRYRRKNNSQEDTLTELQSINLIEDRMK